MNEVELLELYMKKKISFGEFVFFTKIIESIKTEQNADKLANFIKGNINDKA